MKLNHLHFESDADVLREYVSELRKLKSRSKPQVLSEAKRVIVTTEIIDDNDDGGVKITQEAKNEFLDKAKEIGNFENPEWVNKLVNGLKQVGVQGLQPIKEEERPATNREVMQLITALIDLISK